MVPEPVSYAAPVYSVLRLSHSGAPSRFVIRVLSVVLRPARRGEARRLFGRDAPCSLVCLCADVFVSFFVCASQTRWWLSMWPQLTWLRISQSSMCASAPDCRSAHARLRSPSPSGNKLWHMQHYNKQHDNKQHDNNAAYSNAPR